MRICRWKNHWIMYREVYYWKYIVGRVETGKCIYLVLLKGYFSTAYEKLEQARGDRPVRRSPRPCHWQHKALQDMIYC